MTNVSTCEFCPTASVALNGNHWDGTRYIRVDLCDECYDAGRLAKAPRCLRPPRRAPQIAATDWNMLVALAGRSR